MSNKNLAAQIVKAIEVGAEKHLGSSIFYSPFRFFYSRFKRNNPGTMENVREVVRSDVAVLFTVIPDFNPKLFINENGITPLGQKLLNRNYSIGVDLLKKDLSVIKAFKVVTNSDVRTEIYNLVLTKIQKSVVDLSQSKLED